jgi:hypothetical protein
MEPPKEWLGLGWDAWGAIATVSTGLMAISAAAFLTIWATGRADRRKAAEQVYGVAMRVIAALDVLRGELKEIENDASEKLVAQARTSAAERPEQRQACRESARSRWRQLRRLAPLGQPTCRTLSTSGCGGIASAESRASFAVRRRPTCRALRDGPVLPSRASAAPAVCGSTGRAASAIATAGALAGGGFGVNKVSAALVICSRPSPRSLNCCCRLSKICSEMVIQIRDV